MQKAFVGITCLFLIAARGFAAEEGAEKLITKTFAVEPGGEVSVDADEGDIDVKSGVSGNTVEIVVEREASGGSESAQTKVLKANKITFSQDGNKVHVESKSEHKHNWFSHEPNLNVHFRITVPRRMDATLDTAGGNIKVTDLKGTVDAQTSGGNVNLTKIDGRASGRTSGGNVAAVGCTDALNIQTSGGNIVIKDYTGPSALADTSGGNIDAVSCTGKLQVKTSGGNIDIRKFAGPGLFADTSGGSVMIEFEKEPTGDCWLRTSGGSVTARLPENAALNLNASTDGGSVNSSLPVVVQGKMQEGKLEGKIGGGGPKLVLRTSGGDIQIEKE